MNKELRNLIKKTVRFGQFTLTSGKQSNFYVDCKEVALSGRGSTLIGEAICAVLPGNTTALVGAIVGACPLITAASIAAYQRGADLKCNFVRKEPKLHGTNKLIEGSPLTDNDNIVIIEDVFTTGSTVKQVIDTIKSECKARISKIVVLVDRLECEAWSGPPIIPIFTKKDFL